MISLSGLVLAMPDLVWVHIVNKILYFAETMNKLPHMSNSVVYIGVGDDATPHLNIVSCAVHSQKKKNIWKIP